MKGSLVNFWSYKINRFVVLFYVALTLAEMFFLTYKNIPTLGALQLVTVNILGALSWIILAALCRYIKTSLLDGGEKNNKLQLLLVMTSIGAYGCGWYLVMREFLK